MTGYIASHPLPDSAARLDALAIEAQREDRETGYHTPSWVRADDESGTVPVLVVGAGQAGLAVSLGLRRKGIRDVVVVDSAAEGHAGPWTTFARMRTLRTPKDAAWPSAGISAATPRAWFEARYGRAAWDAMDHFPTLDWHAFLEWYRTTLDIPVRFETTVEMVGRASGAEPFEVALRTPRGSALLNAQRIVFATGLEGAGGRSTPDHLFDHLPASMWSHIHDDIDFASLAGARVGVLGGGTGAFDNAAAALEHGAASVTVHMRRPAMPTVSPYRWMEFPGVIEHYWSFSDAQKWIFNEHLATIDQPATQGAIWRAFGHDGFRLEFSSPWESTEHRDTVIRVTTPQGVVEYDHVFAATGISVDLTRRPELADIVGDIALWRDRYAPGRHSAHEGLLDYPYLTDGFAFTPRHVGATDSPVSRLYAFNHAARLSLGVLSHQVSGLAGGAQRLIDSLARDIFAESSERFLEDFLGYDVDAGVVVGPAAGSGSSRPQDPTEELSHA